MAYSQFYPFKTRFYQTLTTTTSGGPVSTTVVGARCKYVGGYFAPNSGGTGAQVTGFDVIAFTGATTGASGVSVVISSGTSVTSTTGTGGTPINFNAATAVYLNPGDIITTVGSTSQAGFVTHIVQEF